MRSTWAVAAAVLSVAALSGCGLGAGVDRDEYVAANEALFAELPTFPGSKVTSLTSTGYRDGESGPVVGYTTLHLLELPEGTEPDEVAAFFERELGPEWTLVEKLTGPVLNFRRGEAFVSVNLESGRAGTLEIAVDHASG